MLIKGTPSCVFHPCFELRVCFISKKKINPKPEKLLSIILQQVKCKRLAFGNSNIKAVSAHKDKAGLLNSELWTPGPNPLLLRFFYSLYVVIASLLLSNRCQEHFLPPLVMATQNVSRHCQGSQWGRIIPVEKQWDRICIRAPKLPKTGNTWWWTPS